MSNLIDRVPQLKRDVIVLAARVEYLSQFLGSETPRGLPADDTRTGPEHGELDGTARASELCDRVSSRCPEHLELMTRLTDRMNKVLGMAEEVLRTLEQIPAKIVDLQLTRIESCDGRSTDACTEAATIMETFGALERAISDLRSGETSGSEPPANATEQVDGVARAHESSSFAAGLSGA